MNTEGKWYLLFIFAFSLLLLFGEKQKLGEQKCGNNILELIHLSAGRQLSLNAKNFEVIKLKVSKLEENDGKSTHIYLLSTSNPF